MPSPVKEGEILAEKYRVERVLGEGGMGVVVAAMHLELDQRVALKFLLPEALAHPEIVERLAREARAAAKIRSQHVARVIDTGKMANGTPFMVMEYLEGKDLAALLSENGALPIETAIEYVLQASEAVAEAHHAGIVHRDLKPSNLFLAEQPDNRSIIKLLDFGISKLPDPTSTQLTHGGAMMGSPNYMSPEQLRESKSVDARADIWALGVILYELIAGKLPYAAESLPETMVLILNNKPQPLSAHRPDVPPALVQAIMKCLCSDREQRYATVADLASALAPFAGDSQGAALSVAKISRVLGHPSQPPATSMPPPSAALDKTVALPAVVQTQSGVAGSIAPPPKSRTVVLLGVCALLVVVGLGVFASTRGHGGASGPGSATSIAEPSRLPPPAIPAATAVGPASIVSAVEAPPPAPSQSAAPKVRPPKPVASANAAPAAASSSTSSSTEQKNPLQMGIK